MCVTCEWHTYTGTQLHPAPIIIREIIEQPLELSTHSTVHTVAFEVRSKWERKEFSTAKANNFCNYLRSFYLMSLLFCSRSLSPPMANTLCHCQFFLFRFLYSHRVSEFFSFKLTIRQPLDCFRKVSVAFVWRSRPPLFFLTSLNAFLSITLFLSLHISLPFPHSNLPVDMTFHFSFSQRLSFCHSHSLML